MTETGSYNIEARTTTTRVFTSSHALVSIILHVIIYELFFTNELLSAPPPTSSRLGGKDLLLDKYLIMIYEITSDYKRPMTYLGEKSRLFKSTNETNCKNARRCRQRHTRSNRKGGVAIWTEIGPPRN